MMLSQSVDALERMLMLKTPLDAAPAAAYEQPQQPQEGKGQDRPDSEEDSAIMLVDAVRFARRIGHRCKSHECPHDFSFQRPHPPGPLNSLILFEALSPIEYACFCRLRNIRFSIDFGLLCVWQLTRVVSDAHALLEGLLAEAQQVGLYMAVFAHCCALSLCCLEARTNCFSPMRALGA